jgi:Aerobic-type carbon monoxide dehydrogenase, middle subunit CoxM/CutM homologs
MKPPPVKYARAGDVAEAVALLTEHGSDAKVLAGGQSLIPLMNCRLARPSVLIDINRIGSLDYVRTDNGSLLIGAMTRQRDVETSPVAAEAPRCCRRCCATSGTSPTATGARSAAAWPTPTRPPSCPP